MKELTREGSALNRIARILSVVLAMSVLGYLVYCAQNNVRKTEVKNKTEQSVKTKEKPVFMPSSKSGNPTPFEPTPGELVTEPEKKSDQKKKQKKKRTYMPSSKASPFLLPPGELTTEEIKDK